MHSFWYVIITPKFSSLSVTDLVIQEGLDYTVAYTYNLEYNKCNERSYPKVASGWECCSRI